MSSLEPLFTFVSNSYSNIETSFFKIPGSAVIARYVKSSHRDDPGRTLLEVILIIFAIRTLLQSRTKAEPSGKHFIEFSEKVCYRATRARSILTASWQEIDELVDEWTPEELAQPLTAVEQSDLNAVPVIAGPIGPKPKLTNGKTVLNLASYNFAGLAGNAEIKERCIDILKKYGLGSCGPPGFYGTQGVWFYRPVARLRGVRLTYL